MLEQYINNILNSDDYEAKFECLIDTLLNEINSDDVSYRYKGNAILKALSNNNATDLLMALCGWSPESILKKAKIIADDGSFFDEIVEAEVYWNDGNDSCKCKVNMFTREIFDIENKDFVANESEEKYVYFDSDETQFLVLPKKIVKEKEGECLTYFWYK